MATAATKRRMAQVANKVDRTTAREALRTWLGLNDYLRACSERQAQSLLEAERSDRNRARFVLRIHARLNRLRGERERAELTGRGK